MVAPQHTHGATSARNCQHLCVCVMRNAAVHLWLHHCWSTQSRRRGEEGEMSLLQSWRPLLHSCMLGVQTVGKTSRWSLKFLFRAMGQCSLITMLTRNWFQEIMRHPCFDKKETRCCGLTTDKSAHLREVWDRFVRNSIACCKPGTDTTVDEQQSPTKARQYKMSFGISKGLLWDSKHQLCTIAGLLEMQSQIGPRACPAVSWPEWKLFWLEQHHTGGLWTSDSAVLGKLILSCSKSCRRYH